MFDRSQILVIDERPWRYTTPPTYDAAGVELTPGVKQTLSGVFVLISDELVDLLADALTPAQRTELRGWIYRVTEAEAATWNVPLWAGQSSAIFLRIPAAIWNDPATNPPAKVKAYFQQLYREAVNG